MSADWVATCGCGKRSYLTRREARQAYHRVHPSERRMNAYLCPVGGLWHIGHLPGSVAKGTWPRGSW